MEGRILVQHGVLFVLCVLFISDTIIAEKTPSKAIKETVYTSSTTVIPQKDTLPGNVPAVNPATLGANPTTTAPASPGGAWCVANPTASETALQVALDYACGYGGADCSAIQPNGACYDPNTVRDHASYAFNCYYQKNPIPTSCAFGGTAQLSNTDPSRGSCHYASPKSTPISTPPTMPATPPAIQTPPTFQTPPSTIMPTNSYTPGGGNSFNTEPTGDDYGTEPTGTPNSAETIPRNLLLIITINSLILCLAMTSFI